MLPPEVLSLFLVILHLIHAQELTPDSQIIAANIYDDAVLNDIKDNLTQLIEINEDLRHRLNVQSMKIDALAESLNQQRNDFKKDLAELKAALTPTKERTTCNATKTTITDESFPSNCIEATMQKNDQNGIYKIAIPDSMMEPFNVNCLKSDVSGVERTWLLIQRRLDGSIDFNRNWVDYRNGFGNLEGEFFIGLDKLHALTQSKAHELSILMEDFEGEKRWATYSSFGIAGPSEGYALNELGSYTGNAGDALTYHINQKWSTKDVDNDQSEKYNCAADYKGAWWYKVCFKSNLNGSYLKGPFSKDKRGQGVCWNEWHGDTYSLKYVHMAIRPIENL